MNDFDRNAWCLLGIPIDVVSFRQALDAVTHAASHKSRCFISTPNLNFIVEASKNEPFRDSIIHSDLVLLDGMPPVWVAKMLGIPGVEKVSGSNLFASLWNSDRSVDEQIKVFLFGGEDGVAEQACRRINDSSSILTCVGCCSPGFGTVEQMSTDAVIQNINQSNADFVLVALGAKKGQAWIMANRDCLQAPVLCHLGAVINFVAGHVTRAPAWMQTAGMEWLWRIWQEPGLWRRYLYDGLTFCRLLICNVMPYLLWKIFFQNRPSEEDSITIQVENESRMVKLNLAGNCLISTIAPLREALRQATEQNLPVQLDLSGVETVDNAFLGLCLLLRKQLTDRGFPLSIKDPSRAVTRIFRWNRVDYLLEAEIVT